MIVARSFTASNPVAILPINDERDLKKRNESGKQRGDKHHASNLSLIILDEHKNPHSNLYYNLINGIAVPGGMLHQAHKSLD
jgi:hypothetical protein